MFLYTVKYNESEYHIKNNNFLYKIHQQHQNTFRTSKCFEMLKKTRNVSNTSLFLLCNMYNYHTSYFIVFVYLVFLYILYFHIYFIYIYIYIYIHIYTYTCSCRGFVVSWCRGVVGVTRWYHILLLFRYSRLRNVLLTFGGAARWPTAARARLADSGALRESCTR